MADLCLGTRYATAEETDDVIASLARYLREPWSWLEDQPLSKLARMSHALGRLLRLENCKRDPLDLRAASEENR